MARSRAAPRTPVSHQYRTADLSRRDTWRGQRGFDRRHYGSLAVDCRHRRIARGAPLPDADGGRGHRHGRTTWPLAESRSSDLLALLLYRRLRRRTPQPTRQGTAFCAEIRRYLARRRGQPACHRSTGICLFRLHRPALSAIAKRGSSDQRATRLFGPWLGNATFDRFGWFSLCACLCALGHDGTVDRNRGRQHSRHLDLSHHARAYGSRCRHDLSARVRRRGRYGVRHLRGVAV
jgi:hypothetical protein